MTVDPTRGDEAAAIVVKPDPDDPFSKGSMCPKAPALGALYADPDRLRYPVIKSGDDWVQTSYEDAFQLVASKLNAVLAKHGPNAVGSYLGNPIVHNVGMMLFAKPFTDAIGSKNVFSATSMDQLPHHFAAHYMFGHEFRIPVPDIDRTDYMIIMGANPIASNGSIMTAAGVQDRLRRIERRGGKFVVIDPRKTETGKIATEHYFITPGRDVYFLLAFLHVLFRDGHATCGTLRSHMTGFENLDSLLIAFTPEKAEALSGISAATIETLVAEYAAQERAVVYGRMGLSTQAHGGLCHWLINCINIVSGHFDRAGGMMFPSPAIEVVRGKRTKASVGRWRSRVRGLNEFYGELPVSTMAEEMAEEGEGQIRAFVTICGNPVLSTPGGKRLDTLLPKLDFMVSIDNYINETSRHADVILPTPTGLENDHYDLIFNMISVSNNAKYSEALFPIARDRLYDWQVLKELSSRIRGKRSLLDRFITPRRIVNLGLMLGPYGRLSHPKRWLSGLSVKKLIASRHGINLGPLRSRMPKALLTPDRRIHLTPPVFVDRLLALPVEEETGDFRLIGRRNVATNNSWMHQFAKLSKSRMVRCTVMINDADAKRLNIEDGEMLRVISRVDEISLPAEVTETMMPGVLSIPHGFGHTRKGTRIRHAEAKPGVSVNDITDHLRVDPLTGNAAFSGQPVCLERIPGGRKARLQEGKPVTVLYASQTGNAEMVARDLAKTAEDYGMIGDLRDMEEFTLTDLIGVERLVLLCSTYGDGDMPDSAQGLWEETEDASADTLKGSHFSVLALGDQSYDHFARAGRDWDERLEALGAHRLQDICLADVDYDELARTWMESALPTISKIGEQTTLIKASEVARTAATPRYNRRNPAFGQLLKKRRLTNAQSSKEVMHYEIRLLSAGLTYKPGDTLNVLAKNDPDLVAAVLKQMGCEGNERIGDFHESLEDLLTNHFEIRTPSRALLSLIGMEASADSEYLWGRDVLDLVREYPDTLGEMETLASVLRPLAPRSYSISSSHDAHPGEVHLTVATVRYENHARNYGGVASGYLARRVSVGDKLQLYVAPNESFSLPADNGRPIILVGPGTGIAPFRAFLEQRAFDAANGPAWLFFGEREVQHDYLYRDELASHLAAGTLARLDTAFSRDQTEKVYVQDRMRAAAPEIWQWLQNDAVIYICGDGKKMAPDVEAELLQIISAQGSMNPFEADTFFQKLRKDKRYLLDVY